MSSNQVNPVEELRREIDSVKRDFSGLISKSSLSSVKDDYSALDTNIANLGLRVKKIRDRKYAFNKLYEQQASDFLKQWTSKKFSIQNQINTEANRLIAEIRPLEQRVSRLQVGMASMSVVKTVKTEVDNFESRVSSVESSLGQLFDDLKSEVDKLDRQLDMVESTLDHSEAASFGFLPGESVVMAVKAVWTKDKKEDKDDPEGILFLTDQRLIFEQKQEVATKKVLFVTTERELIQNQLFEVPVVSVESVKATKQGLFKNEDWIELVLASGSFDRDTRLHLDGQDSMEWQKLITRVKNKDIDAERALAVDQEAVEKVKSAPTECPNCGGAITKPVLRGQDTIKCEFCGNVIRW